MKDLEPDLKQMSRLYEAAIRVKEMAPWEWMSEGELFGVQNPETGEMGYVSVMGSLGEHYSIAVYLGEEGLGGFWKMYFEENDYPEEVLEVRHLQASFEDRDQLTKKDRDVIKELGLKFRGRQAWPLFRSYRPGFFPWYLETQEAQFLIWVLEQVLDVAPRVRESPDLLMTEDGESLLVRVIEESEVRWAWGDRMMAFPEIPPQFIPISMDAEVLEWLQGLTQSEVSLEVDFFLFPAKFGTREERPHCGYMLLVVEGESGFVFGSEILSSEPALETMYGKVPLTFAYLLANAGLVPAEVRVKSDVLHQLLQPLVKELGFDVRRMPVLPELDRAKAWLIQRFV